MAAKNQRAKSDGYDSSAEDDYWSAELPKICGEFLLKTCVGFHPICMITVLVCVLKLQHGRSSVPQVRRRSRQL